MAKRHKMSTPQESIDNMKLSRRKKQVESYSAIGMVLIAATMLVTLLNLDNAAMIEICKYFFAAGAVIFTAARSINLSPKNESMKLRRLRRMEFWAGVSFLAAAFFWFYNSKQSVSTENLAVTMSLLRDTVVFTIAGAVIQIIASWLIYYRERKEQSAK